MEPLFERKNFGFRIGAVIPAAGLSSRMGALKPLLPCAESTVIESAVSAALLYADVVAVVLGYRAGEIQTVLSNRFDNRVKTVLNPDFRESDMLRSVQIGVGVLRDCDGFFLLPGDMPAVKPVVFERLIGAFDGEKEVIYPTYGGRKGHPPLVHASLIAGILRYHGGGGLKAVLKDCSVATVETEDIGILKDLDTPEDYAEMIHGGL